MTIRDIIALTEFETGESDWLEGSNGRCWPTCLKLWEHFHKTGMLRKRSATSISRAVITTERLAGAHGGHDDQAHEEERLRL